MTADKTGGKRIRVRQVRSGIGFNVKQKKTLVALGLGRIGKTREHPDNEQVRAMVRKIPHLVVIVNDRG
jgi:large subunit ribosomal protein L30